MHGQPLPFFTATTDEDEEGKLTEDIMKVNPFPYRICEERSSQGVGGGVGWAGLGFQISVGRWLLSLACIAPRVPPPHMLGGAAASAGGKPSLEQAILRQASGSQTAVSQSPSALCPPPQHAQPFEFGKCTSGFNNQLLGSVLR